MFSFITKLVDKLSSRNKPQAPKSFQKQRRSLFLNRYAGLIYFLIAWHAFGYVIISLAKNNANKEGLEIHEILARGGSVKKIEIGKNFDIKTTEISTNE